MTAETLARQAGRVAPAAADAVLGNFCRLLGIAAGGTAEGSRAGGRRCAQRGSSGSSATSSGTWPSRT